MRAAARRREGGTYTHTVRIGDHSLIADEPAEMGGADLGPNPQELLAASLASCVAITLAMYAQRKGWDIGTPEVVCEYEQPQRGQETIFSVLLRLPDGLEPDQIDRLTSIAGRCPVHRVLEGPVRIEEAVELVPAGRD